VYYISVPVVEVPRVIPVTCVVTTDLLPRLPTRIVFIHGAGVDYRIFKLPLRALNEGGKFDRAF
jgi:hypothetical protein